MPGPGESLFNAVRNALGGLPLVAEDLGHITAEVHELRRSIGIPGMRVLQFAFQQPHSPHLPHCYPPETVVYTGTHDNDTARGWYEHASALERANAALYLGLSPDDDAPWALIRAAYADSRGNSTVLRELVPLRRTTIGWWSGSWSAMST